METAGLGVGVAGLFGLYNLCRDVRTKIHSFKDYRNEGAHLITLFEAEKQRFDEWVQGVQDGSHDEQLRDKFRMDTVFMVLKQIQDAFEKTAESRSKIPILQTEDSSAESAAGAGPKLEPISVRQKFGFVYKNKSELSTKVEQLRILVDKLYQLVPLDISNITLQSRFKSGMAELRNALGMLRATSHTAERLAKRG
jgi:hypothetical protein